MLQGLLQRQFGTYLEDFDKQQINVGVSGFSLLARSGKETSSLKQYESRSLSSMTLTSLLKSDSELSTSSL